MILYVLRRLCFAIELLSFRDPRIYERRGSFRKQKDSTSSKDIPIAAFAVKVAKELLHETSTSPLVLAATPRSLSKSLNNLSVPTIKTNSCDDENSSTAPSCKKKFESYPYHPLNQMNEDDVEG